jgi:hypothetical protein
MHLSNIYRNLELFRCSGLFLRYATLFVHVVSLKPEHSIICPVFRARYRLAFGTSEKLQLGALVGAFTKARIQLIAAAE